jgi:hypothetical protein
MKKFLMLSYGHMEPTSDVVAAWMAWFEKVADHIVDSGNPLGRSREITRDGSRDLTPETGAAASYTILSAESMEEAERLLDGCPFVDSVRLYEALAM